VFTVTRGAREHIIAVLTTVVVEENPVVIAPLTSIVPAPLNCPEL